MELKYKATTDKILEIFYSVYNELGYGFLEKVYQNAMLLALTTAGLHCRNHCPIKVFYQGTIIGEYYADILVEDIIILELKAAECIAEEHEFQLLNYLKATSCEVGLLLNFGKRPQFKRKIFENDRKKIRFNQ